MCISGISSISSDLFVMKERDNPVWGVGATLFAPIFTAGALQAQVTGLDVDDAGQRLVVLTYRGLHVWARASDGSWADTLAVAPQSAPLPPMRKAEAMALSADGRSVLVGSEHRPTPLWSHPLAARRPMAAAP